MLLLNNISLLKYHYLIKLDLNRSVEILVKVFILVIIFDSLKILQT